MGNHERVKNKRKTQDPDEAAEVKRSRPSTSQQSVSQRPIARAGKIAKIHIKNLFCHDSLEMVFNPNVNFIVGKNGSGKSAILAALTVGLGARASITRRGDCHKSMIKTGKTSATIEITLVNTGSGAYKPEIFGDTIRVVRTITQASSSYYSIKKSNGETVSKKKADLDAIVSHLQIQVENPISVLNQDTSKDFLLTATEEKKYEFFMKATQLEEIGNNYREAIRVSQESKDQLRITEDQMREENARKIELEDTIKKFDSIDENEMKLENYKHEFLWAKAIQEEFNLSQAKNLTEKCEKNLQVCIENEKKQGSRGGRINEEVEELQTQAQNVEAQSASLRANFSAIRSRFSEKRSEYKEKGQQVASCKSRIHRDETNLRKLREEIQRIEEGTGEAAEKRQKILDHIEQLKDEIDRNDASMKNNEHDRGLLENNKNEISEKGKLLKAARDKLLEKQRGLRSTINSLHQQQGNTLSLFGRNMPRLIKRLEEEFRHKRLTKMPIGPVGSFINIRDSTWIPAVEKMFGFGTFSTICVDNHQDAQRVKAILKEVYGNETHNYPKLYVSKFLDHVHNVSGQSARSENYINLLSAMEINNVTVTNYLIDSWGVESTMLIPTSQECSQILNNRNTVPVNCKKAITKSGDTFYPQPNYKTYGGRVSPKKYLQVSSTEAIASTKQELNEVDAQLKILETKIKETYEKIIEFEREFKERMKRYSIMRNQQTQLKKKCEDLTDEINSQGELNQNLPLFKEEVVQYEEKIANTKQQASKLLEEEVVLGEEMAKLDIEVKRQQSLFDESEEKVKIIRTKIQTLEEEKNQLDVDAKHAKRRVEEATHALQAATAEEEVQKRVTTKTVDAAEKNCRRIKTKKSPDEINKDSKALKARIETLRQTLGNRDELVEQLRELQAKHGEVAEFLKALTNTNEKHLKRVIQRKHQYNQMKKLMGEKVEVAFLSILKLRKYKGKIEVDHKNNKLRLEVVPVNTEERDVNDARTLSGGERSYSTVAFILALWECTQVPFYFMDEFDVYMDKINRRIVMDCLLEHAREHPECQFGFLTPLDASNITAGEQLQIHRMPDPDRRNAQR